MKFFLICATLLNYCFAASIYGGNSGNAAQSSGGYGGNYGDTNSEVSGADDQDGDLNQSIVGSAGVDYPAYHSIPETRFRCKDFPEPGYYADQDTRCQAFHICQADGAQDSFLCPNGTLFNQQHFICDWWYNVDCAQASNFYGLNAELYRVAPSDNSAYGGSSGSGSGYGASSRPAYSSSPRPSGYGGSDSSSAPISSQGSSKKY